MYAHCYDYRLGMMTSLFAEDLHPLASYRNGVVDEGSGSTVVQMGFYGSCNKPVSWVHL